MLFSFVIAARPLLILSLISGLSLTFLIVRDKITDRQDLKRHAAGDIGHANSCVTWTCCVYGLMWESERVKHLHWGGEMTVLRAYPLYEIIRQLSEGTASGTPCLLF